MNESGDAALHIAAAPGQTACRPQLQRRMARPTTEPNQAAQHRHARRNKLVAAAHCRASRAIRLVRRVAIFEIFDFEPRFLEHGAKVARAIPFVAGWVDRIELDQALCDRRGRCIGHGKFNWSTSVQNSSPSISLKSTGNPIKR